MAGYTLGEPAADVESRVPEGTEWKETEGSRQASVQIVWLERPAKLGLALQDGVLSGMSIFSSDDDSPIEDVRGWARRVCDEVAPEGERMVAWGAPPSRRFMVPFDKALHDGATLACVVNQNDEFLLAASAHDVIAIVVEPKSSKQYENIWRSIRRSFVPFDWADGKHVGDPIQLGAFKYIIDSIEPTDRVGKNRYMRKRATDGATFLVVRYRVENTGNETAAVMASDLVIRDTKARTFRASSGATTVLASEEQVDLLLSELQPGIPRKQLAVFEVPDAELARLDLVIPEKGLLGTGEVVIPLTFSKRE